MNKLKIMYKKTSHLSKGLLFGLLMVAAGLILVGVNLFNRWHSEHSSVQPQAQVIKNNSYTTSKPLISGAPARIQVPSVTIDLKVVPGYYYPASKSWSLTLNNAQWGVMTPKPNNQGGDTFIYAHYRKGVFLTLPRVQPGAEATITTDNGHVFTYTFRASQITSPSDTSLFSYKGKPILVLQTCSGLWYQNRQLFVFDLQKVS